MAEQATAIARGVHGHVHTSRCYWDYNECHWVCRPAVEPAEPEPLTEVVEAK